LHGGVVAVAVDAGRLAAIARCTHGKQAAEVGQIDGEAKLDSALDFSIWLLHFIV